MKSAYGPTLGRLLAPRWWAASRLIRAVVIAAVVASLGAVVALGLTLQNAAYSRGGKVPFSFEYRGLCSVRPDPGAFVKIDSRDADGALKYSYEVYPLTLPPYAGGLSGAIPIFASSYIAQLARREPAFVLIGEGKARLNSEQGGYAVLYRTEVEGHEMYARNILLLPEREGAREGVIVALRTSTTASSQVKAPAEVATTGVLLRPLKTFTFG